MFFYPKTVVTYQSPINGEIKIVKLLGSYRMVVGRYTQSGGLLEPIWKKALQYYSRHFPRQISNVLILGLGAGTVAKLIQQKWPTSESVGIEIDPLVLDIGNKYFNLDQIPNLRIICKDAFKWIEEKESRYKKYKNNSNYFDLIFVDMYIGEKPPEKSTKLNFIKSTKTMLNPNGVVFFNRIINRKVAAEVNTFETSLRKIFSKVIVVPTPANKVFLCLDR